MKHKVYLSLGSNDGDRKAIIASAIDAISDFAIVENIASLIETKAWGYNSEKLYINTAIKIITDLSPLDLLKEINRIEYNLGRKKRNNIDKNNQIYEDRTIDIDIIFYDNVIIDTELLNIPHPHFKERYFVLAPILEIDPDLIDPKSGLSIRRIYQNLENK